MRSKKIMLVCAVLALATVIYAPVSLAQQDQKPIGDGDSSAEQSADNQDPSVDKPSEVDQEPPATVQPPEVEEPQAEQPPANPDATFTPTEEISEDKPVAFPVDI
jgi:hypothetical protein